MTKQRGNIKIGSDLEELLRISSPLMSRKDIIESREYLNYARSEYKTHIDYIQDIKNKKGLAYSLENSIINVEANNNGVYNKVILSESILKEIGLIKEDILKDINLPVRPEIKVESNSLSKYFLDLDNYLKKSNEFRDNINKELAKLYAESFNSIIQQLL